MRQFNRFERGSGVYKCHVCERSTRRTGDGAQQGLCEICWDIAGWQNTMLDNPQDSPEYKQAEQQVALLVKLLWTKHGVAHPDFPEMVASLSSLAPTTNSPEGQRSGKNMAKTIKNSNVAVAGKQTTTPAKKAATPQVAAIKGTAPLGVKPTAKTVVKKAVNEAIAKGSPVVTEVKHPTPTELASGSPAPKKAAAKAEKKMGKMDAFGFGENSQTSWILRHLAAGKHTRQELTEAFVKHFTQDDKGGDKRKKISLSVFFSDLVKPFKTYHASRGLIIITDPKTKKLSLDAKRADAVREAIGEGMLKELKGLNKDSHPTKINAILKKHGLPLLEVAAK